MSLIQSSSSVNFPNTRSTSLNPEQHLAPGTGATAITIIISGLPARQVPCGLWKCWAHEPQTIANRGCQHPGHCPSISSAIIYQNSLINPSGHAQPHLWSLLTTYIPCSGNDGISPLLSKALTGYASIWSNTTCSRPRRTEKSLVEPDCPCI